MILLPVTLFMGLITGPEIIAPWDLQQWRDNELIVSQLRLPRVVLSALVGAVLAVTGVLMQGLFRNPLADPSLIGVTAGASAGASIAIVLGGSLPAVKLVLGLSFVATGAFAGALLATLLVYRLAASDATTSVSTMLLAGIAISALAGAVNNVFQFFADNHLLRQISLWQMGSISTANWSRVLMASPVFLVALAITPRYATALNAMLLGESEARHLGVDVERVKIQLIVIVSMTVGVAVSLAGTIAFVGLITPHMVRLLMGPNHRYLIPCSALAGAILLTVADALARTLVAPTELPVGVLTATLGAPFFLSLLRQQRNQIVLPR